MSVIEDSRKVLQDFIAPELRAIDARLTALEKRFDEFQARTDKRFDEMQARTDKRFDDMQKHMDQRFDQVMAEIRRLSDFQEMQLRIARIENRLGPELSKPASSSEAA